jgi:hypothetical protein
MKSVPSALTRLVAVGATGAVALAGLAIGAAPANAAVMVSGSVIDPAGNYVSGTVYAVDASGNDVAVDSFTNGAYDLALPDGAFKLEFSSREFATEWYRDKPDQATADVVTVAGVAQTLPVWTVDRRPSVTGVVRTADGTGVAAYVNVHDAATGSLITTVQADRSGAFRVSSDVPVKLQFSGYDPKNRVSLATEWFNDKVTLDTADPITPTAAGADVGVVTMAPGGTIAGRVTSEAGAPVHRAQVCAGQCDWTDVNGDYLIEGVAAGTTNVTFRDPIGEFVGEYWNNVPLTSSSSATQVFVAPGQAVTGIDAALAAAPVVAPNGVDLSGTVRDELGNVGVGYKVDLLTVTADARDAKVVGSTRSNRAGQYAFTELDRIGGQTQFKVRVSGGEDGSDLPREKGDFARRTTWSGDRLAYSTATVVTATSPGTLDVTLPVAGGVSGAITSDAGGVPENSYVNFRDSDNNEAGVGSPDYEADGTYDFRALWAGDYTVQFGASFHASEWWKNALPEDALPITVRPGQMVTGISASLAKEVKAIDRPSITGNAWVGKTLRVDNGRWNTQSSSRFSYEWLANGKVVATGTSHQVTRKEIGKKITARVTNDAGFAQGQALTKATVKVGLTPKLKAKVSARSASFTLKVKSLKSKKVKASVVVYEVAGKKKNGEPRLKKLGKGTIANGKGSVRFSKPLRKGKHTLVFRLTGKGKVGSGDLTRKVRIRR